MIEFRELFEQVRARHDARKVPATLSHCVLAVRKKGKSGREAWEICRASLTRYGYLRGPYKKGGVRARSTQKGVRRDMKHANEPVAPKKFRDFKKAYRGIRRSLLSTKRKARK